MRNKDERTMRGFIAGLLLGVTLTAVANYDRNRDRFALHSGEFFRVVELAFHRGVQAGMHIGVVKALADGDAQAQASLCESSKAGNRKKEATIPLDRFNESTAFYLHHITKELLQITQTGWEVTCDLGWQVP